MQNKRKRVYVAGHRGMVGAAIVRILALRPDIELVIRTHAELDLTSQEAVRAFFRDESIDEVYLAAAKVGGIYANDHYPADFIYQNLMIEANVIHEAWRAGVQRLLFLGSSCIYPKFAEQPIDEDALLSGKLEPTNEPYAIAKIAGIKLCESYNRQFGASHGTHYRSVMPTNLYGPGDNYSTQTSHVVPALIRRFHEARSNGDRAVRVWGSGRPRREFLYVDDMAAASVYVMEMDRTVYEQCTSPMQSHINVGFGSDVTIAELAQTIAGVVDYEGEVEFDASMPDGTPRKLMNSARLRALGWQPTVALGDGLARAYAAFVGAQPAAAPVRGFANA
ncbi:GDP-L-fucose synthase [Paraburkholderia sp. J67]|uniref:GDP-L-fucose synthase family protein n=1 Tax=Paraburkholderia sp. J67 TaxID=2805435 RepID=UPI002ABDF6BF|nr:GDP-L-fucose synthase [Paraburkholderia sp. J67]